MVVRVQAASDRSLTGLTLIPIDQAGVLSAPLERFFERHAP